MNVAILLTWMFPYSYCHTMSNIIVIISYNISTDFKRLKKNKKKKKPVNQYCPWCYEMGYTYRLNTMNAYMYTDCEIRYTYTHSYCSCFRAKRIFFMHAHIHICVGVVSGPSHLFLPRSSSIVAHEMFTISATIDPPSASFAFCSADCGATFTLLH